MTSEEERRKKRLIRLEAALYAAGRPLNLDDLKYLVGTRSDNIMNDLVKHLSRRYRERDGALEVKTLLGDRVVLQLGDEYSDIVEDVTSRPLLSMGPLKTLSYVAYNQPVLQSHVVEDRGSHIYSQLRRMEKMGLITREPAENGSFILRTTPYFADYFGFSHDPAKSKLQLRRIFNQLKIKSIDNGDENFSEEEVNLLADSGDGLPERFSEYPRASDSSS
ncbi:MAG: SMC-Scp complex subunit ScpB [Candidatus Bathyarchaeia archaeon]